jgi:hypothetical protein
MKQSLRKFKCEECGRIFKNKTKYKSHQDEIHNKIDCWDCNKFFNRRNFFEHFKNCSEKLEKLNCKKCKKKFTTYREFKTHELNICNNQKGGEIKFRKIKSKQDKAFQPFKLGKSSFNGFLREYELESDIQINTTNKFFIQYKEDIHHLLKNLFKEMQQIKIIVCLHVLFTKISNNLELDQIAYFCSNPKQVINRNDYRNIISMIINELDEEIDNFQRNGSNWVVENIFRIDIKVAKYLTNYNTGGCYKKLPMIIQKKRAIINIKNADNKCFIYSVIAKIFPTNNNRTQNNQRKYLKHLHKFNLKNCKFPMEIKNIGKFERDNKKLNFKINVFEYNSKSKAFFPSRISGFEAMIEIDLLLLGEHYYLIKSFNRLVGKSGGKFRKYCKNCSQGFENDVRLLKHR